MMKFYLSFQNVFELQFKIILLSFHVKLFSVLFQATIHILSFYKMKNNWNIFKIILIPVFVHKIWNCSIIGFRLYWKVKFSSHALIWSCFAMEWINL